MSVLALTLYIGCHQLSEPSSLPTIYM
jgi:hypothetical protein